MSNPPSSKLIKLAQAELKIMADDGIISLVGTWVDRWLEVWLARLLPQLASFGQSVCCWHCSTAGWQPKSFRIRLFEPDFEQVLLFILAPNDCQTSIRVGPCWWNTYCYFQGLARAHRLCRKNLRKEKAQRALQEKVDAITDVFPFAKLPGEIRDQIYRYAFNVGRRVSPYGYVVGDPVPHYRRPYREAPQAMVLLQTSRQIRSEAGSCLYSNVLSFTSPVSLSRFMSQLSPETRATIRRIELAFDHEDYLCLFGFLEQRPDPKIDFAYLLQMLQELDLNKLTIFLPSPWRLRCSGIGHEGNRCHLVLSYWIINSCLEALGHVKDIDIEETHLRGEIHDKIIAEIVRNDFEGYESLSHDGTLRMPPICGCASPCRW